MYGIDRDGFAIWFKNRRLVPKRPLSATRERGSSPVNHSRRLLKRLLTSGENGSPGFTCDDVRAAAVALLVSKDSNSGPFNPSASAVRDGVPRGEREDAAYPPAAGQRSFSHRQGYYGCADSAVGSGRPGGASALSDPSMGFFRQTSPPCGLSLGPDTPSILSAISRASDGASFVGAATTCKGSQLWSRPPLSQSLSHLRGDREIHHQAVAAAQQTTSSREASHLPPRWEITRRCLQQMPGGDRISPPPPYPPLYSASASEHATLAAAGGVSPWRSSRTSEEVVQVGA